MAYIESRRKGMAIKFSADRPIAHEESSAGRHLGVGLRRSNRKKKQSQKTDKKRERADDWCLQSAAGLPVAGGRVPRVLHGDGAVRRPECACERETPPRLAC